MSYSLLERFIESELFNKDPSLTIQYLSRYADHVGIQYVLCSKLRQFSYEELEFYLPQLCHLLISVDNESMALEEFILDLCEESVNAALLTFWLFQTYLHDLSGNPASVYFKTCRRVYNKVQRIVFGADTKRERIKENVLPVTVLSSLILASIAAPFLPKHAGPLAIAQARRPRPVEEVISDASQIQLPDRSKLNRSHTVTGAAGRRRVDNTDVQSEPEVARRPGSAGGARADIIRKPKEVSRVNPQLSRPAGKVDRSALAHIRAGEAGHSSASLPEIRVPGPDELVPAPPKSAGLSPRTVERAHKRHSNAGRAQTPATVTRERKIKMLRTNYFRSQTAFLTALEDISNKLVSVPKPARLSALRAELALIAQDLPAEVDVPLICPATLVDGQPGQSKHHRIVRLNPAEATSLNSAERVPYLLMVEVLRDDFDFDPDTEENVILLSTLLAEKNGAKRRLFDITDSVKGIPKEGSPKPENDSVLEPINGDLGASPMLNSYPFYEEESSAKPSYPVNGLNSKAAAAARSSSGTAGRSSLTTTSTPRTSLSRSNSPVPRRTTLNRVQGPEQPDVSALATHMRAAAQMLAQLDQSGSKRPKTEVAAIKAKIIASMQSLEEQSFFFDEVQPTFDTIMAKADVVGGEHVEFDEALEAAVAPSINAGAGEARMENDQITGGVRRGGDRDDPSAATFGEDWSAKRERIRKTSPFGWMKNWDLVSVIVKTGADLRQEAFACQLIGICAKIWESAKVPVWVKQMRILVTGESSGLIETIANGSSLHSIKRSLTLASAAPVANARKRMATLDDHFLKAFGEPDTDTHIAAVDAFARSLAAYSMICYVLQLKDRHNGNILIDNFGHMIHIDFGFMLSNSPGNMGFEAAPFKLTQEYIDVLGGMTSPAFDEFKSLCKAAFQALRREAEKLVMLVDVVGQRSQWPCFKGSVETAVNALRARFVLHLSKEEAEAYVEELIQKSAGSYYTRLYDTFQYRTQGIY